MPHPRRVLILSHSHLWAGATHCLYLLLKTMDQTQWKPIVMLPQEGLFKDRLEAIGIETHVGPIRNWMQKKENRFWHQFRFESDLRVRAGKVARFIRQNQIDIVVSHTANICEGALAAHLTQKPHLWYVLERMQVMFPDFDNKSFFKWMDASSDQVMVLSKSLEADFQSVYPSEKVKTNSPGLEPFSESSSQSFASDKVRICYLGRLSKEKGVLDLVDCARKAILKHGQLQFVIVGYDDGQAAPMKAKIKEYELDSFFEFVPFQSEVQKILASSDLLILPSRAESFGLVLLEAMLMKKPVVATRSGGPADIVVEGQTGFLVEVQDTCAMADRIVELANDRQKRFKMGAAGYQRAIEHFSLKQYGDVFEKTLEALQVRAVDSKACEDAFEGFVKSVLQYKQLRNKTYQRWKKRISPFLSAPTEPQKA